MEGMEGGDTLHVGQRNDTEEVKSEEKSDDNQKTAKGAWLNCQTDTFNDVMTESVEIERPIFWQEGHQINVNHVNAGHNNPDTSMPTDDDGDDVSIIDGEVEMMIFEGCPASCAPACALSRSHSHQNDNQNNSPNPEAVMGVVEEVVCASDSRTGLCRPGDPSEATTGSATSAQICNKEFKVMDETPGPGYEMIEKNTVHLKQETLGVLDDVSKTKESVAFAMPIEGNAVYNWTESNMNNQFALPITVSELVVTNVNFRADGLARCHSKSDIEPEDNQEGPRGAKVPRLHTSEDNLDEVIEIKTSSLPSPVEAEPGYLDQVTSSSPVRSDMEIRKNLMTVLSPSQSSSIGSLSTQISPSTCSLDYSSADSITMEDTEQEILCYPTFEELQQSFNLDSSSESIAMLSEAILKNAVLTQQENDENQVGQPGLPLKIINCHVQPGNPAFTTPHRPWSTKIAPLRNVAPQPSEAPPRRIHFGNLPRTTTRGNISLPAKGTPHPAEGVYMPGQSQRHQLGFPQFRPQTPTGYIIRQAAPHQKTVGLSPHASSANISLNSSGEENCNTSPEEATPPLRVPYNTPQSGIIVNNRCFPLCNRLVKDTNILAQLEETVKNRVQSSPKTLEGFAKFGSPFPAEVITSDGKVHTVPDQGLFTEEDLALGRDHHNAKERRRRLRIKDASNKLREIVPGLTSKTDKATVFEYAVEYIMYMKQIIKTKYDRQFMSQCSPY